MGPQYFTNAWVGGALQPGVTSRYSVKARLKTSGEAENDKDLVRRVKEGEVAAFKELVERYQKRAHAIALGVVGSYEDAEDVVQEAFLKAYRNIGFFRGQSSFYTWLYRIVFNLAIDHARKRYRHTETSMGDTETLDNSIERSSQIGINRPGTPDEGLAIKELGKQLAGAIETLSPDHRAVIVLREIEGLSYSEISDVIGCSKGTVMSRLHHARKKLQKTLKPFMDPAQKLEKGSDPLDLLEDQDNPDRLSISENEPKR